MKTQTHPKSSTPRSKTAGTKRAKSATKYRWSAEHAQLDAAFRSQAVIEFELDGTIVTANANFLQTLGYTLEEIQGRHHRIFVEPTYAASAEYREFWDALNRGEFRSGEYRRLGKGGKEVWIQASYNPVFDKDGRPWRVIKFASDITAAKMQAAETQGQINAINKSQAVIEFQLDGTILTANENFTNTVGYSLTEIQGRHHRMFVAPEYSQSHEYQQFWEDLRVGKVQSGEFRRLAKGGREIWIEASYNLILDQNRQPMKVVKYATDITARKQAAEENARIRAMLDNNPASITFSDKNNVITYVNPAAKELLRKVESFLPVKVDNILGQSIDVFHKNPHHQRSLIADARNFPFQGRIKIGPENFELRANRILDLAGNFAGTFVSWENITEKLQREQQVLDSQERERQHAAELIEKVGEILTVAQKVARRDYSQELTVRGEDAIGRLGEGLSQFFRDKQTAEQEEEQRSERERRLSQEQQRKVAVILDSVNAVADGNFDIEIPNLGDDAVGQVASALHQAVVSMKTALREVRDVAGTVSAAAGQLTDASREISSGAQSQASSLEETASSLEEITSTVKQNSDNAQQARQLANGSRDVAEKGGSVVSSAVQAMGEINQSSKKIADIITTIDEIAFQTNLLALNAAVEAARAGEQGRGFAVVASEVRNLAQRSASAAKEIKALIQDSVRKVENGTDLVNKSGQTLSEIVSSVKRVTDIVSEIAAASKEQLTGIEQVNKAVAQMDRVTQANAAQTEEMSGTAAALLSHAVQLNELVSRFKLDEQQAQATTSSRTHRPQSSSAGAPRVTSSPEPARQHRAVPVTTEASFELAPADANVLEF